MSFAFCRALGFTAAMTRDTQSPSYPDLVSAIRASLPGELASAEVVCDGDQGLPSWFDVTGLAAASIGVACAEIAALGPTAIPHIRIDRALASFWFDMTIRPDGWQMPPVWDAIAGLYKTSDGGWIRLHTNAPHHRSAALAVLQCEPDKAQVARAVSAWVADDLELAMIKAGGCAARMRSLTDWAGHDQGMAVAREPLIAWEGNTPSPALRSFGTPGSPLAGLKVLDCTRVLAGPICTRLLAGYGAEVLRLDPPGWDEANVVPEVILGKRTATLDLASSAGRDRFSALLAEADVFVHGYRPGALDALGFGRPVRSELKPGLIDVALCAYGWTGPWAERRGFDSLVQMSCGIAHAGMMRSGSGQPTPLPVQALDHATGYLMAASVARALRLARDCSAHIGSPRAARLSLARTAALLTETLRSDFPESLRPETAVDLAPDIEMTDWGPARRLKFPLIADETPAAPPRWTVPARRLHRDPAVWLG